jgi:hypothetical protein
MTAIEGWDNFYVIVGSSAGALIGLQFVVITLIADSPLVRADKENGGTFATPTVIHFGMVLLLSALISAPWSGLGAIAAIWLLLGLIGFVYAVIVARRLRRQKVYQLVFEDQLFHAVLPLVAYTALTTAGALAFSQPRPALYLVGASSLLLLFIGIHNAWDAVTYHVFVLKQIPPKPDQPKE